MAHHLSLIAAAVYAVIATTDITLCFAGQYARHNITYPVFTGFHPRHGTYFALLLVQHSIIFWWILDTGAYGQSELPGYLMPWFGFDALTRIWKLRGRLL